MGTYPPMRPSQYCKRCGALTLPDEGRMRCLGKCGYRVREVISDLNEAMKIWEARQHDKARTRCP